MAKIELEPLKGLKGLSSLSSDEQRDFINRNVAAGVLPKRWTAEQAEQLYQNKLFIDKFGVDTFRSIPDFNVRGQIYKDKVVGDTFTEYYGSDKNFAAISADLSTDGKLDLMESGYLNDEDLNNEISSINEKFKQEEDWAKEHPILAGAARTDFGPGLTSRTHIQENADKAALLREPVTKNRDILTKVRAKDDRHVTADSKDDINTLFNFYKDGWNNWHDINNNFQKALQSDDPSNLDGVVYSMVENKLVTPEQGETLLQKAPEEKVNLIGQILQTHDFNSNRIDNLFGEVALPREFKYTDDFGEERTGIFPGSNYYYNLKDTERFKDFGPEDKLREYVTWQVIAQKYGVQKAMSALETSMADYAKVHEKGGRRNEDFDETSRAITLGGIANIMDKVNGINNIGVLANRKEEGLAYHLEGKDAEGKPYKQTENGNVFNWFMDNALNPKYWKMVEDYNTFDPILLDDIDKHGGISPYNATRLPDEPIKLWSKETLKEALKMMKFVWSDALLGHAIGGLTSGLTGAAGALAAFGNVALSSTGIAEAYGINTYQQSYQSMMENLDNARLSIAEKDFNEHLGTEEAQNAINKEVAKRVAQQDAAWEGRESPLKTSEEEIRRQVESEYKDSYISRWEKDHEDSRRKDESVARKAAAHAYIADATMEQIRMMGSNFVFRKYLFDRGTLSKLGDNTKYTSSIVTDNGRIALGNTALGKTKAALKPFVGGFISNYNDDLTVGGASAFGEGQYNDYLRQKYDPETAVIASDIPLSFLSGFNEVLSGVQEASTNWQSFYDGIIGALGTPVSVMPRLGKRSRQQAREDMGVRDGDRLSFSQWFNLNFTNPLLNEYYAEVGRQRRTSEIISEVNKIIEEHGGSLEDIIQIVAKHNKSNSANSLGSTITKKDYKEDEAFQLLRNIANQKYSPLLKEFPLIQNAFGEIDRLAKGNITEDDVNKFLNQPENSDIKNTENAAEIASERLQKNAQQLQKMSQRISEASAILDDSSVGKNMNPDIKEQLMYMLSKDDAWRERADEQERIVSGKSLYGTGNSLVERLSRPFRVNNHINPSARFGNERELNRQLETQELAVLSALTNVKSFSEGLKSLSDNLKSLREDGASQEEIQSAERGVVVAAQKLDAWRETLSEERARLKEMERLKDSSFETITAEDILNLSPIDRAIILNDSNRTQYSEEQQAEIDRAKQMLVSKNPDALTMVQDIAELSQRVEDNRKAYNRFTSHPLAATAYAETLKQNRVQKMKNVIADRLVDNLFDGFDTVESQDDLVAMVKSTLLNEGTHLNAKQLQKYIDKNPERNSVLNDFQKVLSLQEDLSRVIKQTLPNATDQAAYTKMVVDSIRDANTVKDAMSSLEDLMNSQTSPEAARTIDRILENAKSLGYQRDAVKVRDREKELAAKIAEEKAKAAEEAKKDGKNYNWNGYKVGDTVYDVKTGLAGTVESFEKEANMKVTFKYADGTKGTIRYDGNTQKNEISKEKPAPPKYEDVNFDDGKVPEAPAPESAIELDESSLQDVTFEISDEGKTSSPSAAEQAASRKQSAMQVAEDSTDQGNNISESADNVLSGTRLVEYSIQDLKEGIIKEEVPENPDSYYGRFYKLMRDLGVNLQQIIDKEFGRILKDNPDIKVHFLIHKGDNILLNVIEYTKDIQKYHEDARGGVIEANGKSWLIVGNTGFPQRYTTAQRNSYLAAFGQVNKRALAYFNTNKENFYVDQDSYTQVQNTTSGRIVLGTNQVSGKKKISNLLRKSGRTLKDAEFGIQTAQNGEKSFAVTKNVPKSVKVFPPRNAEDNRGRVFILLDTANGNKIPGMIEPAMLSEIDASSSLRKAIDNILDRLTDPNYEIRLEAIKELRGYLVLDESKNILIGNENLNKLTIKINGDSISQPLDGTFNKQKFFDDIQNANFALNITLSMLEDPYILKMYDESGALQTLVDDMTTAGMSYTVYPIDTQGRPIITVPAGNAQPGTSTSPLKSYTSVRVGNNTYDKRGTQFINRATHEAVVPNTPEWTSCVLNDAIKTGNWVPFKTSGGREFYSMRSPEGALQVVVRDQFGNCIVLNEEDSKRIQRSVNNVVANSQREENLRDVNLGAEEAQTPVSQQAATQQQLTQEQIQQQYFGDFSQPATQPTTSTTATTSETVSTREENNSAESKEVITGLGRKKLSDLQSTNKFTTFESIATSEQYGDMLYDVLENKDWGITGDYEADAQALKRHGITLVGIDNVEKWIDQIKDCK